MNNLSNIQSTNPAAVPSNNNTQQDPIKNEVDERLSELFKNLQLGDPIPANLGLPEPLLKRAKLHVTELSFDFMQSPELKKAFYACLPNLRKDIFPDNFNYDSLRFFGKPIENCFVLYPQILQFLPTKKLILRLLEVFKANEPGPNRTVSDRQILECLGILKPRLNDIANFVMRKLAKEVTPEQPTLKIPHFLNPLMFAIRNQVTSLDLSWLNLTDENLVRIVDFFPNLREINLGYCPRISDAALVAIAQRCPNLQSLELYYCPCITDASVLAIAQRCPNLQSLKLWDCPRLTDASVVAIAQRCPKLQSLELTNFPRITDAALVAITQRCPNLQSLKLSNFPQLTDAAVVAVAQGRPNLQSLTLRDCPRITDASVVAVAQGCPNLQSLKLWDCPRFSDAGVVAIAQRCPNLQSLKLYNCPRITDAALVAIAEGCSNLQKLELWLCPLVTENAIEQLRLQRPAIDISDA